MINVDGLQTRLVIRTPCMMCALINIVSRKIEHAWPDDLFFLQGNTVSGSPSLARGRM